MSRRWILGATFLVIAAAEAADDRIVLNAESAYPEGPLLVGRTLYYAEMGNDRVMRFAAGVNSVAWTRPGCGPTSVARGPHDTLIVLCHLEPGLAWITPDGATLEVVDNDAAGRAFTNPNGSVNDAAEGVYFTSSGRFNPSAPAEGAVLHRDRTGRIVRVAEGIHYANGVALSGDGKHLFVSEHLSRRVLLFDVQADASLTNRRTFVALDGLIDRDPRESWLTGPDGLAVDRDGNLFIAEYGAGRLLIVSPEARLLATVLVPELYVDAVALSANESRLFVTAPSSFISPTAAGRVYSLTNPLSTDPL